MRKTLFALLLTSTLAYGSEPADFFGSMVTNNARKTTTPHSPNLALLGFASMEDLKQEDLVEIAKEQERVLQKVAAARKSPPPAQRTEDEIPHHDAWKEKPHFAFLPGFKTPTSVSLATPLSTIHTTSFGPDFTDIE